MRRDARSDLLVSGGQWTGGPAQRAGYLGPLLRTLLTALESPRQGAHFLFP